MYSILIVDDETPVRDFIKALGQWKDAGVDHVYEAFEGGSALEIMRKNKIGIVFLDMNMPDMNGVEFLKVACKEFPKTKYIVISGYEDFEYTKQAIHSRVLEYLLKPIVESELNHALMRAVQELEEDRIKSTESIRMWTDKNMTMPLAREKVLLQLLEEDYAPVTAEQRRILGLSERSSCMGIVILSILNMDRICLEEFNGDMPITIFAFTNVINELASHWCSGFSFKAGKARNEIILAVIAESVDAPDFEASIPGHVQEIIKMLEELFGAYCIACIGKLVSKMEEMSKSYRMALDILYSINILQCSERIFTRQNMEESSKRSSLLDKKETLLYAFESGRAEYAGNIIGQYFENVRQQGFWSKEDLHRTAMEFLVIIEDITERLEIPGGKSIISEYRRKDPAAAFTKMEEFSEFIYSIVEQLLGSVRSNRKAGEKTELYEIKNYIEKNFSREIPLSYFSDKYFLSKDYLSKQFRDEFGYGIHEYILRVRMEKAGEMICDSSVKIQSVSSYLGYKDNYYFSRAFKAYYGVSPTEYREKHSL